MEKNRCRENIDAMLIKHRQCCENIDMLCCENIDTVCAENIDIEDFGGNFGIFVTKKKPRAAQ